MAKIKSDEREDLKVLATGVSAALAARKVGLGLDYSSILKKNIFDKTVICPISMVMNSYFCSPPGSRMRNLAWAT